MSSYKDLGTLQEPPQVIPFPTHLHKRLSHIVWNVASVDHIVNNVLPQLQAVLFAQVPPFSDDANAQQCGCLKQEIAHLGGLCMEKRTGVLKPVVSLIKLHRGSYQIVVA